MQTKLSLEHINFGYGKTQVIKDFSLDVQEGSFTTLLGQSGCGKTTLLKLISGFLEPDSGLIKIDGQVQNKILPNKRHIGMVFQDYALFPHLTVEQNLSYGLSFNRKMHFSKEQKKQLVHDTAQNLGLLNLLNRYPGELSGGQQQRVALGRVLVLNPAILLMDEPLSSLDTSLRVRVREELKEIQSRLKITTVYVTHDQEEALSLSDRIAIIDGGMLLEEGTPKSLYFEPSDSLTGNLTGKTNVLLVDGKEHLVRPEWIKILDEMPGGESGILSGALADVAVITGIVFLGSITRYTLTWQNQTIFADVLSKKEQQYKVGQKVKIKFPIL